MRRDKPREKHLDYDEQYLRDIKNSVKNGSYFKDAVDWYFFRYVNPLCERTILILASILAIFMVVLLVQIVKATFPLVEKYPIVVSSKDQSKYFPNLVKLKQKSEKNISVDEAVARYLIKQYVINREAHDYRKASIEDINTKFNRVRNTSSASEYENFQSFMSKDNPDSPVKYFGKDAYRLAIIESVSLIKEERKSKNFLDDAQNFFKNVVPKEAEVRFVVITKISEQADKKEKFLVKINFNFSPIDKASSGFLKFIVNKYTLFKVK